METPDLSRIVETHVPVETLEARRYLSQLRMDVLPHIRHLQATGSLRWFSFLLHQARQVAGQGAADNRPVFHLRLEPAPGLDLREFVALLPPHFIDPHPVELSMISGVNLTLLERGEWAKAWRVVGESAEWVLCLLEAHADGFPPDQLVQFLHYVTNALGIGGTCVYAPNARSF